MKNLLSEKDDIISKSWLKLGQLNRETGNQKVEKEILETTIANLYKYMILKIGEMNTIS